MRRLSDIDCALLAAEDASLLLRLKARFRATDADRAEIDAIRRLRQALPAARELPEYFAWESLAAEMKANILLGVEAGEAVRPRTLPVAISWRAAVVMAMLSMVVVAGYWWRMPHPFRPQPAQQEVYLEATQGQMGIEQEEAGFLVMVDERSAQPVVQGAQGAIRTDYVDQQTGQLTVAHVYAE